MGKKVVILIGPPGSGKDTQADLLERELKLAHIKTSELIENKFKNSETDDPELKIEKEKWATGELVDRDFVLKLILEKVRELHQADKGLAFSGSPREVEEARSEIAVLEELYGKENIKVTNIDLSEEESVKRNSHRRMCEANRHPIPDFPEYADITVCPEDGSPIVTRQLDDPEIIRKRYQVYKNQTEPVFDYLSKRGYNIIVIDGKKSIPEVHRDILDKLL